MTGVSRGVYAISLCWIAVAVVGVYFLWPFKELPRRGIDLVGGFYITLKVDVQEGVKLDLAHRAQTLSRMLEESNLEGPVSQSIENNSIVLTFKTPEQAQSAQHVLREKNHMVLYVQHVDQKIICTLTEAQIEKLKEDSVEGNVDVLRKRLNELGVAEIPVSRQGDAHIIIELPSVDNPAQAKEMIGKTSQLEIKEVIASAPTEEDLLDQYEGILPEGMMLAQEEGETPAFYLVPDYTDLTGRDLKNASFGKGQHMESIVNLEFNSEGTHKFSDLTKRCIGKKIAIIVDDKVITAPVANDHIKTGTCYIHGRFTEDSAKALATMLRSGAFLAPITFEEERRIGPSLGAESIKQGLFACIISLALLFLFAIIAYRTCGLLAFFVLIYNLLLLILFMVWIRATLTLPGIAGMVLTLGMAIDSSVLIYEKIKEALKEGISFKRAVDLGFSDAMMVILDSNITTFLMALVLYKFGTGPVQGFAVTLILGIVSTLITGLFLLRTLFNVAFDVLKLERISI